MGTEQCSLQQTEFAKVCSSLVQSREQLQERINMLAEQIRDITRPLVSTKEEPKPAPRETRSNMIDFIDSQAAKIADITASVQRLIDSLDI